MSGRDLSPSSAPYRWRFFVDWAIVTTVVAEAITLLLRFGVKVNAAEFNRSAPLLLQVHHLFWAVPLAPFIALFWRRPPLSGALAGLAAGLIVSDLAHHFLVLPITVGNTGWHWP